MDTRAHQHPRVLTPFSRFIVSQLFGFIDSLLQSLVVSKLKKDKTLTLRIKAAQAKLS
ncbi:hypothetical protein VCRA2133E348_50155 [Vibrio crassostreae]|nr:hypothetical protein VCRA2133E348_50155 [Vibrio crassostreae]CAK3550620.1 hypothetical protein VCRA213O314_50015 [Vibrio crassostreae]